MRISTRNQLDGTVAEVNHGQVTSTVKVTLQGGAVVTASITKEAAEELGLASGDAVKVLIKASDVMIAKE